MRLIINPPVGVNWNDHRLTVVDNGSDVVLVIVDNDMENGSTVKVSRREFIALGRALEAIAPPPVSP